MDTKVLLVLDAPVRECSVCTWKGIILNSSLLSFQGTPIFEFEAEWPSAVKPDIAKFCPFCREPLKARAG